MGQYTRCQYQTKCQKRHQGIQNLKCLLIERFGIRVILFYCRDLPRLQKELLYRIEVLYASQAFCQTAPVTTDVAVLSGHYQLVDAYIQCLTKERRLGQPAIRI